MKDDLTYDYVSSRLRYEQESGKLFWKELLPFEGETKRQATNRNIWNNRFTGKEAGTELRGRRTSYKHIRIGGKKYLAHRLAWLIHHKEWPRSCIDHINQNGLDNRIQNLRDVTDHENHKNIRMYSNNTSGATGVHFHEQCQKWQARIRINGKDRHLGLFEDFDEAVKARKKADRELNYHPNHGRAA